MNCPYPDCEVAKVPKQAESCESCQQFLKACSRCGTYNRAFANFCRACRTALAQTDGNWLSYLGDVQRLGLNSGNRALDASDGDPTDLVEMDTTLQLGDACRSLLAYDRHVVAVAQNGSIEIVDPEHPASRYQFSVGVAGITCEPCIDRGLLYVGCRNLLSAFSLGRLTLGSSRPALLWQIALNGTPVHALTALDNRLYVTVWTPNGRELQVIDNPRFERPTLRAIAASATLSWVAADARTRRLVYLTHDRGELQLHTITHGAPQEAANYRLDLGAPADQPIALVGRRMFGVFGDERRLLAVDVVSGMFEQAVGSNTLQFALTRNNDGEWSGEVVRVERNVTTNVLFQPQRMQDSFASQERIFRGCPLIIRGRAAILAQEDGQIRFYELAHLPRHRRWHLSDTSDRITAMASFRNYVAVGSGKGLVKVIQLRGFRRPD